MYDVVILGAGLAGLCLARHLLVATDCRVLLLERRGELPRDRQKVGESTVQLGGYYLSKVLELEQHLLGEHLLKYNLRFYWKSPGRENRDIEDLAQVFIRRVSNIASYQVDRNRLEAHLLDLVTADPRATVRLGARDLEVSLSERARHSVTYRTEAGDRSARGRWLVDATGRARYLSRQLGLRRPSPIRHGAYFLWLDGAIDIERLTGSDRSRRSHHPPHPRRRATLGHFPSWLSTHHLMGDGFWFWIIPLRDKTSLGLVFDRDELRRREVSSAERLLAWAGREFPLLAPALEDRAVLDFSGFTDVAHDCTQAISPSRWALVGDAARFSDPLYSPGVDLIALHSRLIVDAVQTPAGEELDALCRRHDRLLRALYEAYVPSYTAGYGALGDQEAFALKYAWELSVYFAFYVFPFVNDLLVERRFAAGFLRRFSRLGAMNRDLQRFLAGYADWKAANGEPSGRPVLFDLGRVGAVARAEETFARVGLDADEAREVLDGELARLERLARDIIAHVSARVRGDGTLVAPPTLTADLERGDLEFDAEEIRGLGAPTPDGEAAAPSFADSPFGPLIPSGERPTAPSPRSEDTRGG